MPKVKLRKLTSLLNEATTGVFSVVATAYSGILGAPALFHACRFPELLAFSGDRGAGAVIRESNSVVSVFNENASFDIDTPSNSIAL